MKTLWTFGDSLTSSFIPPETNINHWKQRYADWKGYTPKVYGEFIADTLDINLINKGFEGIDNSQIFENFCINVEQIQSEDILIFGWTNQERIRLVTKENTWGHFSTNLRDKDKKKEENDSHFPFNIDSLNIFDSISKNTIIEIMFNRMNTLYINELCNWIKLINFSFKNNKIIHWSWDQRIQNCGGIYINNYETVKKETNNIINDYHWSENTHNDLSNFFIEIINNELKIDKKFI
jgi:hypothetical protein